MWIIKRRIRFDQNHLNAFWGKKFKLLHVLRFETFPCKCHQWFDNMVIAIVLVLLQTKKNYSISMSLTCDFTSQYTYVAASPSFPMSSLLSNHYSITRIRDIPWPVGYKKCVYIYITIRTLLMRMYTCTHTLTYRYVCASAWAGWRRYTWMSFFGMRAGGWNLRKILLARKSNMHD